MPKYSRNTRSPSPEEKEEYDIVEERPPQETELDTLDRVGKTEVLGLVSMQKVNAILMEELLKCNSMVHVPSENYHYEENIPLLDNANKKTTIHVTINANEKIFVRISPHTQQITPVIIDNAVQNALKAKKEATSRADDSQNATPSPPSGIEKTKTAPINYTTQYDYNYKFPDHFAYLKSKNTLVGEGIPVEIVVNEDKKVFVRVGPCDLSGVGGHTIRKRLIEAAVNSALTNANLLSTTTKNPLTFKEVNVCAQVSVRGRGQMVLAFLHKWFNAIVYSGPAMAFRAVEQHQLEKGTHQNAYLKVANEDQLTHWEPRQKNAPQPWYNDTICAMVVLGATHLFENKVMSKEPPKSTSEATKAILENQSFKAIFKSVLATKSLKKVSTFVTKLSALRKEFETHNNPVETTQENSKKTFNR